jgi:hypothetical protein
MKSGPDVFADALVPRNAFVLWDVFFPERLFPEPPPLPDRSDSPRIKACGAEIFPIDRSQASAVSLPSLCQMRHRSRIRVPARRELPDGRRSCATSDRLPEPVVARCVAACRCAR